MYKTRIAGVGSYIPEGRLTNHDLEQMVETSDDWIVTRTGISARSIAAPDQYTSDLAFLAAQRALADAGLTAEDLDMILVGTETPDHPFPSVACQLQHRLGCRAISAVDLHVTCVGFLSALETADAFIRSGKCRHILVVGADNLSRITDYTDRTTCILFSDGAGAFVVSQTADPSHPGILHTATHANGEHYFSLYQERGGSIKMDGRKIFKLAVTAMTETTKQTLEATGKTIADIDWLIPHQANQRIIDAVAEHCEVPNEKVISTIKYLGNNSSATIPIAFDLARQDGRIKRGDTLLLTAFGGGLVWGSALLQF
ncbi:3-oxoacyl-[acyl-carrier-protein] synthase III [Tumebacillus sp. BK434]|uniref:beta-ketoacyl-ACP synthase III n=1 Tax=Tumebacillus sp. BK434 TaxID=2512169 RepID=UPI0010512A9A|nr:beta-ketoacyl-ACP synthase III [Tumebacillus sp. BK434]TCP54647.1 3-oxoacyl-[acyl-carrier-protein] synthase III [Tumebacillus sp. BK434]